MVRRYWERLRSEVSAIWARLTGRQRLAALAAVAAVAVGMVMVGILGGAPEYVTLGSHADAAQVETMARELSARGLDVRRDGAALRVPAKELPRALAVAGELAQSGRHQAWSWLWQDPKWGETEKRIRTKEILSRTADLEEAIEMLEEVGEAHIGLNLPPRRPLLIEGETPSSASVTVSLRAGREGLSAQSVRVIRAIVGGGTGMKRSDISVADNRRFYPHDEDAAAGGSFDEIHRRYVAYYERKITELLVSVFRRDAFTVMVDLELDRQAVRTESQLYGEPVSAASGTAEETETETRTSDRPAVGLGANVRINEPSRIEPAVVSERSRERTEETKEVRFSETRELKTRAPGDIEKISVLVRLDKKAVYDALLADKRVLEGEKAQVGQQDLTAYVDAWRQDIARALGIQGQSEVSVRLDTLTGDALVAGAGEAPSVGAFLRRHAGALVLGALALAAIGAVFLIARRSIPATIEIPSLEAVAEAPPESAAVEEIEEPEPEPDEVVVSARAAGTWIKRNPASATSLIRMWLGGEAERKGG